MDAGPREVVVESAGVRLAGDLIVPPGAAGLVVFAHGSGSSRKSPRNRAVAEGLQSAGLATLLFDLLTAEEEEVDRSTRHLRFDIELLTTRLVGALEWLREREEVKGLPIGLFGASTGAAAALRAAARAPGAVAAVVSRGGRPDLAGEALPRVRAPTLLIVGGHDPEVLELNRDAYALLGCEKRLEVVAGATHLFEEPGALERVAERAADWFVDHLVGSGERRMVPSRAELSHATARSRRFADRTDAGRQLAEEVARRVDPGGVVVLGLPRGGVPVAWEVARVLHAPLDVLVVRKLGVPWQPELAFGAVSAGDVIVYDDAVIRAARLGPAEIDAVVRRERHELDRRERLYRGDRPQIEVDGRTVVLVDDGIATGSTVRAGLRVLERLGAARRVVACPVAPPDTVRRLEREADQVICLLTPRDLGAIGLWYDEFDPVEDHEVVRLLRAHSRDEAASEIP